MSPDSLLRQFEVMADAPNGVQKLRELILQLAVRGKLVPQDPGDEPASVLLERIAVEKQRLFKEGQISKPKPVPPVSQDEVPYEVPEGWKWVRMEVLFAPISSSGNKVQTSEYEDHGLLPVIDQGQAFIAGYTNREDKRIAIPGPVVVFGDHTRALKYVDFDFVAGADGIKILFPVGIWPRYFHLALQSIPVEHRGYGRHYRRLIENVVPLPPLPEQRRIVAKVDELMALCDRLEARQQRRAEARARLHRSALHHLTTASDDAELAAHWQRLQENFHLLYDTPETVAELRQALLQLAVRGKLVPQDPSDEPASVLLERIAAEKQRLFKEGKISKPKPLPPIGEDEAPFEVPEPWRWVRWAEVANNVQYGYTASADPNRRDVRLLRITDIQNGRVDWEAVPGCEISPTDVPKYELHEGDLLIARTGGTIGKSYLVPPPSVAAVFASYLIRLVPATGVAPQFMLTFARSPLYWEQLIARSAGTGQPNVNGTSLSELIFPLPPLPEQQRIVAKVDELMALCDRLEAQLTAAREKSAHLAASVVHHLAAA